MIENNKSYRVRTKIGTGLGSPLSDKYLTIKLDNSIDTIEMMSLKISQNNFYRLTSANYGAVVGRVIANGGFGVPNVRVSIFVPADEETLQDPVLGTIYPYTSANGKNTDKVRYNLLDNETDDDCHRDVGTFPTKRMVLDDDNYLEIFDKYYKFTTRTNESGDYMIFGVPVGSWNLHVDMDLSDIGILSQKPRDMVYKGYSLTQFDSPSQFKESTNLDSLPQIISQDTAVYIYPFWGDESESIIGITRFDVDVDYKFEPTCVFIGSIISDTGSNKISKKCIPSESMGSMEDLVTGPGTIEMIRKTITGSVEEFPIQGNRLIDDHGVWCYQIPMNLDYMMTDEFGNLVPSDNPEKGIPTRASVRFRVSMDDLADDNVNSYRCKVLVPNNPEITTDNPMASPDYVFGTRTDDSSYRDLFWNNIYTIKSYIPRFQRGNGNSNRRFSGVKMCNYYGSNNPMPYNNMRVRLSFQFRITCLLVKILIALIGFYNKVLSFIAPFLISIGTSSVVRTLASFSLKGGGFLKWLLAIVTLGISAALGGLARLFQELAEKAKTFSCLYIDASLCPSLEDEWYFAPGCTNKNSDNHKYLWLNMMGKVEGKKIGELNFNQDKKEGMDDTSSIDYTNKAGNDELSGFDTDTGSGNKKHFDYVISRGVEYFKQCIEISLAEEYRVIQFDFYNDWINGTLYIPRWERHIKRKRKFFFFGKKRTIVRACNDSFSSKKIRFTEQCALSVRLQNNAVVNRVGCKNSSSKRYVCHKKFGRQQVPVFSTNGAVHQELTASDLYVYYFKPCEVIPVDGMQRKVNLFATDIVLLGAFTDYSFSETPKFIDNLHPTTYQLPSPLALTDAEEEGFSYTISDESKMDGNFLYDKDGNFSGLYAISNKVLEQINTAGFTEMSGIDWGFTGPGQGIPNKSKNYTPGGHFLGISCMNSEVTTKSCVNLRRICELGVWPSSSYRYTNGRADIGANLDVEVVPNGLIAKDDITESYFRSLFATLNQNGLKTIVDGNGKQKYDLTYLSPASFGGDLSSIVKNNYNRVVYANSGITGAYATGNTEMDETTDDELESNEISHVIRRSSEQQDTEYRIFRLGLSRFDQNEIRKKYLLTTEGGYAMPVWNNSFYFYFGLHNGSTALDKFRQEFYSECPKKKVVDTEALNCTLLSGPIENNTYDWFKNTYELPEIFDNYWDIEKRSSTSYSDKNLTLCVYSENYPIAITHVYNGEVVGSVEIGSDSDNGGDNIENGLTTFDVHDVTENGRLYVGTHTFAITDGDGRTFIGNLVVSRPAFTICENVVGADFGNVTWVEKGDSELIDAFSVGRGNDKGWIEGYNCGNGNGLFEYKGSYRSPADVDLILVLDGSSYVRTAGLTGETPEYSGVTTFLSGLTAAVLDENSNEQFLTITNGNTLSSFIPVWSTGIYALYVVMKDGARVSDPILLSYFTINEPDAIDFTLFRESVGSESDAVNTYRNTFAQIIRTKPQWWNEIGTLPIGELKKWYLKKDVYLVSPSSQELYEGDSDDLFVTTFFGDSITDVEAFGKVGSGSYSPISKVSRYGLCGNTLSMYCTGSTVNDQGSTTVIRVPDGTTYFNYRTLYKPFKAEVCVWEGFVPEDDAAPFYEPTFTATINNCIMYDEKIGNINDENPRGCLILNQSKRFRLPSNASENEIKFTNQPFFTGTSAEVREETKQYYENIIDTTFEITEGYPANYNSEYSPLTFALETQSASSVGESCRLKLRLEGIVYSTRNLDIATRTLSVTDIEGTENFVPSTTYGDNSGQLRYKLVKSLTPIQTDGFENNPVVVITGTPANYYGLIKTTATGTTTSISSVGVFSSMNLDEWKATDKIAIDAAFRVISGRSLLHLEKYNENSYLMFFLPFSQDIIAQIVKNLVSFTFKYTVNSKNKYIDLVDAGCSYMKDRRENSTWDVKGNGISFTLEDPEWDGTDTSGKVSLSEFYYDAVEDENYWSLIRNYPEVIMVTRDDNGNIIEFTSKYYNSN